MATKVKQEEGEWSEPICGLTFPLIADGTRWHASVRMFAGHAEGHIHYEGDMSSIVKCVFVRTRGYYQHIAEAKAWVLEQLRFRGVR